MRWQRIAQAAIAVFVLGFIVVLVITLRREAAAPVDQPPPPERGQPDAVVENPGGCEQIQAAGDKLLFSVKCGKHFSFPDGRQRFTEGVEVNVPRDGREFIIRSTEAEVTPKDDGVAHAVFTGDVRITNDSGLDVRGREATYSDDSGELKIPGPVEFTRGRTKGSGVGATYDRNREVLWLQEQARLSGAPNPRTGEGAFEATARSIGFARQEHYARLVGDATVVTQGRTVRADELVLRLTEDEERVRAMELRGNSRIAGGEGGPSGMSARDIDLTYAADGRTLEHARLVENAVLDLGGAAGRRIAAETIELGMGPDGTTVTTLTATNRVQVDIPAEGQTPAKTIRSATLTASGEPGAGLRTATFRGGVEYREARAASRGAPAAERTAHSNSLVVDTKPGLGAIERADFRGNVKFVDAPDMNAEAPQGIYFVERDRLELVPGENLPGSPPLVTDGNLSVSARTITLALATRELSAETKVRSTMRPRKRKTSADGGRLPSMLNEEEEVNVTANRLTYNGRANQATYSGSVTLWQGSDTTIRADTIAVDDSSGNLTATGNVATVFVIEEAGARRSGAKRTPMTGTADTFTYDEARRLATYDGEAHINGPQGDVTGTKIELFMKPSANELQRAEAYGKVVVVEGNRMATGSHLTYTAEDDRYLMVGTPVEIVENKKGSCTRTIGTTATFNRTTETARVDGNQRFPSETQTLDECPARLKR